MGVVPPSTGQPYIPVDNTTTGETPSGLAPIGGRVGQYWPTVNSYGQPFELVVDASSATGSKKRDRSKKNAEAQQQIAGSGSVIPIIYGRRRIGAKIATPIVHDGALVMLAVWCIGEVDAVESVFVNDEIPGIGITITNYTGTLTQTPDPTLIAAFAAQGITYDDALIGKCYSVVTIRPGKTAGFPRLAAIIRGMKVRSTEFGARAYSTCPAYCLADFIESQTYGAKGSCDWATVATLATLNNQDLGGGNLRHTLNLALDTVQQTINWITTIADYANTFLVVSNGKFKFIPDAAGSSVRTFDETNILKDSFQLQKKDITQTPTVFEVTFTDMSTTPWRDLPIQPVEAIGVSEGTVPRRVSRVQKVGINNYAEANRYAIQKLNEGITSDLHGSFVAFDDSLDTEVGDIVSVTHPIGLSSKLFRVMGIKMQSPGRWALNVVEYDPAKYSDVVVSGPTTIDTNLPSPLVVPDVEGLAVEEQVYQIQTGRFASRLRITWSGPTLADYVFLTGFNLEIMQQGGESKAYVLPEDTTEFLTDALPENQTWTITLSARSELAISDPSSVLITNNGKQTVPTDVPSITGYSVAAITYLNWEPATDLDLTAHELRYGLNTDTWEDATLIDFIPTPSLTLTTRRLPVGTWRIFIKGRDSVRTAEFPNGQESVNAAFVDIEVVADPTTELTDFVLTDDVLTNMAVDDPGWITAFSDQTWDTLFPNAMTTYPNPVNSYHTSGTSGIVSDAIDLGESKNAQFFSDIDYVNLTGTAQPYFETKVNIGDSWTRANGTSLTATCRYVRVGIDTATTGTLRVYSLGTLLAIVDATETFLQFDPINYPGTFL